MTSRGKEITEMEMDRRQSETWCSVWWANSPQDKMVGKIR